VSNYGVYYNTGGSLAKIVDALNRETVIERANVLVNGSRILPAKAERTRHPNGLITTSFYDP